MSRLEASRRDCACVRSGGTAALPSVAVVVGGGVGGGGRGGSGKVVSTELALAMVQLTSYHRDVSFSLFQSVVLTHDFGVRSVLPDAHNSESR